MPTVARRCDEAGASLHVNVGCRQESVASSRVVYESDLIGGTGVS